MQDFGDFIGGLAGEVHIEHSLHYCCFRWDDFGVPVLTFLVAEHSVIHKDGSAFFEVLSVRPSNILADAFGFGLCESCVYDKVQFAITFQRIDVLFLKVDAHADFFE